MNKLLLIAPLTLITACSDPLEPTFSASDVEDILAENDRVQALAISSALPTEGSATYTGQAGGFFTGDEADNFVSDLVINADFVNSDLDGRMDNINFVDENGIPTQMAEGGFDLDGDIFGTTASLVGTGSVTAVNEDGFEGTSSGTISFLGDFRDDDATADAISGTLDGSLTGDFDIELSGEFFVTQ